MAPTDRMVPLNGEARLGSVSMDPQQSVTTLQAEKVTAAGLEVIGVTALSKRLWADSHHSHDGFRQDRNNGRGRDQLDGIDDGFEKDHFAGLYFDSWRRHNEFVAD